MASLRPMNENNQPQIKGLQLNPNKLNTLISICDDNQTQQQPHQQPDFLLPLKPALVNQLQPQQQPKSLKTTTTTTYDENYSCLFPLKPAAAGDFAALKAANQKLGKQSGRDSPKEPEPPKLKSYTRPVAPNPQPLAQHAKQQQVQEPQPLNLITTNVTSTTTTKHTQRENPIIPVINLKQQLHQPPQLQPPQQQESIISRIPRLSLKFPLALLHNNQIEQQRDAAKRNFNIHPTAPSGRLTTLAELQPAAKGASAAEAKVEVEAGRLEDADVDEELEEIEDIDKSTSRDAIFLVCDIAKDIYDYMYQLEETQAIRQDHLKEQNIFTPKVRQRLINWCIEIHSQLKLLPETLYLTIAVIDRFMDQVQIKQQSQVTLAAVGATLIASKYEEIYPPDVGDLMHLTQNSYTRREIMRIEIQILEQLNFDLGKPIPLAFLRRFSKAAHCDVKMHAIAKYLMELSLSEYECSHWRPSMLAAAALYTTLHLTNTKQAPSPSASLFGGLTSRRPATLSSSNSKAAAGKQSQFWTRTLTHYTRYESKQLQEPAAILCKVLKRAHKSPQSYACVKKNMQTLMKWPELKSTKVDELIKLGGHQV